MESADTLMMWMYQRYTCGRAIAEWCLLTFKPFWLVRLGDPLVCSRELALWQYQGHSCRTDSHCYWVC